MSTTNPYASPRGRVADYENEQLELADRFVRLGAHIVDGIIAFVMIGVPAIILLITTDALDNPVGADEDAVALTATLLCVIGFIAWAWITALLVMRNGQTIAKRLFEIKVVRSDGSPASLGRILVLRNLVNMLLSMIPFYSIIDVLLIFGEKRQCIHDLIADTIVVKA